MKTYLEYLHTDGVVQSEFKKGKDTGAKFSTLKTDAGGLIAEGGYRIHIHKHIDAGEERNQPCIALPIQADETVKSIEDKLTEEGV